MMALPILSAANVINLIPRNKSSLFLWPHRLFTFQRFPLKNMSQLPTVQIRFQGVSPLLCHNGQTADPRNAYSKAMKGISGKRKKTDSDYDELARLEWLAGLYRVDGDLVIPDYVIESAMIGGAKKSKRGPQAKCGLFFTEHASLLFEGKPDVIDDETLAEMFASSIFTHTVGVKVGMAKIMRTRPMFRHWRINATAQYDPDVLNIGDVAEIAADAGKLVGLGDWRPKHGRFEAEVIPAESLNRMLAAVA
jgi:hypothetical protein